MGSNGRNIVIYLGLLSLGLMIGGYMIQYIFAGVLTLLGFVVLVMSLRILQWFIYYFGRLFDIVLFIFGVYATMNYGVTIAMSLTVAGLGYTMIFAPYIRATYPHRFNKQ